ncbi:MAG: hypothetical protein MI862_10090 [Desulfobacterales bacterium]|nr:hypothetical protein [Desulfobacterales bacterium]
MKKLTYSIKINKPKDFVFNKITDKSVYPGWAKAWGEGMTYEGEWKEGSHISFFDQTQGGTKAIIEKIVPNESILTKHVAMVNPQNIEIEPTDDMMKKWIGSQENYYFKKISNTETTLEIVMIADEAFEKIMDAWSKALQLFKEICEA